MAGWTSNLAPFEVGSKGQQDETCTQPYTTQETYHWTFSNLPTVFLLYALRAILTHLVWFQIFYCWLLHLLVCPKWGGWGQGHFWTTSKRKTLFYLDVFPNRHSTAPLMVTKVLKVSFKIMGTALFHMSNNKPMPKIWGIMRGHSLFWKLCRGKILRQGNSVYHNTEPVLISCAYVPLWDLGFIKFQQE